MAVVEVWLGPLADETEGGARWPERLVGKLLAWNVPRGEFSHAAAHHASSVERVGLVTAVVVSVALVPVKDELLMGEVFVLVCLVVGHLQRGWT